MAEKTTERPADDRPIDEKDVDGHAFKWQVVDDPRTGRRQLRQGWNPDDPPPGRHAPRSTERHKPHG